MPSDPHESHARSDRGSAFESLKFSRAIGPIKSSNGMERMRITWLLEAADQLSGEVKVALEHANWLHGRGHRVVVSSRTGSPDWMRLQCGFQKVHDFRAEHLPDADVIISTAWTTMQRAAGAGPKKGVPVHFCQHYEGDEAESESLRERIEAAYRLPRVQYVTTATHVTELLNQRFQIEALQIVGGIDHTDQHGEELEAALGVCRSAPTNERDAPASERAAPTSERSALRLVVPPAERGEQIVASLVTQLKAAGLLLRRQNQAQPAARLFAAALVLAPDDVEVVRLVARAHHETGAPGEALRCYDDLAARGLDDAPLHAARGHTLHALGQLHEAAQAFRAALATGARSADVYNHLGVVLFKAGDLRGARASFERALALQPDHRDARANLAALPAA
jgi:tetratricopeptide (TPR) repeat protein